MLFNVKTSISTNNVVLYKVFMKIEKLLIQSLQGFETNLCKYS